MTEAALKEYPRTFLSEDVDLGDWDAVEPWLRRLTEREVGTVGELEQWLRDVSELQAALSEERARRYIAMTCNTGDEEAERRYLHMVQEFMPKAKPWLHRLNEKYVASPHREGLDAERYGVLDRDIAVEVELYREQNIELQTRGSVLSQKYQKISGAMTVEFRGRERTLPQMGKFLEVTERDTREEAWRGVQERRLRERGAFDEIFDELISLRDRIARNADCADYREYTFKAYRRFDYTPADCLAFHEAVETCVMPLVRQMAERRRSALELEALRPWDYAVDPLGREPLQPFDEADELGAGVRRILGRLDPELQEQFTDMLERGDLDLESRKGKAPGGYQSTLDESRRPFIFMNAAGLHRDVETLLHEAGHAFHALAARDHELVDYRHAPIEFAEVASMTMELFADDLLDEFYDEVDAARAKRKHLEGIIGLMPWIARVDAFQHWIYTHPGHSPRERTEAWVALEQRFEPPTDWSGLQAEREASWQRQLHVFCYPFYYIEYGIAQLGALQIWDTFKEDQRLALGNYRAALALGGSRPLPELFAAAGARFRFDAEIVQPLMDRVGRELERLPE